MRNIGGSSIALRGDDSTTYNGPMARSRITLRDVAQHVGVHESTVSRVLNEKTRHMVTPEVAGRVADAAHQLGYQPNPIAYSLKTNRTLTIGVLIPDLRNPVFPPIIRGIEDVLAKEGYTAILANSDNDPAREGIILGKMKARQVDGLILATAQMDDALVAGGAAEDIPVVLINRTTTGAGISSVANDDAAGIHLAVAHLADLGHTRIAHVAGPQTLSTGKRRYDGFLDAVVSCGLTADATLIAIAGAYSETEGRRALNEIFSRNQDFTAVVAANDLLAIGCYDGLAAAELDCPANISVTGFNDMPFADRLNPPLTTVRIPHYEMGETAALLLLRHIGNPSVPADSVLLKRELVVRASTSAPSPA